MESPSVVVVGTAMVSPIGLTSLETAASIRCGTMRFAAVTMLDARFDPFVLAKVPDDALDPSDKLDGPLTNREARILSMGSMALEECLNHLPEDAAPPPLFLALPERNTTRSLEHERILERLREQFQGRFSTGLGDASLRGRAGGVIAIGRAARAIREGWTEFCIAGGIDSFHDLHILGYLDVERRVKSNRNLDGFTPGEGAAFLLLADESAARAAGHTGLPRIAGFALGFEPGHLFSEEPYRGDGLAAVFRGLADAVRSSGPFRDIYSSMNGESYWAKEWGVALIRNQGAFASDLQIHHPADCYGDPGSASGPLLASLAAIEIVAGRAGSPALVYASSDAGERAAIALEAG